MKKPGLRLSLSDSTMFALIVVANSVFSKPIPTNIGVGEAAVASLIAALAIKALLSKIALTSVQVVSVMWLFIVPSFIGIMVTNNSIADYTRDIVPLFFLLIPLIFRRQIRLNSEIWLEKLSFAFLASGCILSARYLFSGLSQTFGSVPTFDEAPLNQCPSVIFAAIYGGHLLFNSKSPKMAIFGGLAFGVCFTGLLLGLMRAQIVIVALAVLVLFVIGAKNRRINIISVIAISGIAITYGSQVLDGAYWAYEMAVKKTELGGGLLNNRDLEASIILSKSQSDLFTLFLGEGWGSSVYLPTANANVRFAHQAVFFYLWKIGVAGIVFYLAYIFVTLDAQRISFTALRKINLDQAAAILSILSAYLVFTGIEMGYKMLSYSMMFCLLQAWIVTAMGSHTLQPKQNTRRDIFERT